MKILKVKIIDPIGLHARPASKLANVASKFKSDIKVMHDGREGNAKSVINLMALGIRANAQIEITALGQDEVETIEAIKAFLEENKLI